MIVSALISQCRRQFRDIPKIAQASQTADGISNVFNLGKNPIVEGSYNVFYGTSAKTESTHYTLDKDSGDLRTVSVVANGIIIKAIFSYANFRDQNWVEAINHGIDNLNARGFFRQISRNNSLMSISAGVRTYSGPTGCVDLYEVLEPINYTISGNTRRLRGNWKYDQDANKLALDYNPTIATPLTISYLRNLQTYNATSATIDVLPDWLEMVKAKAGSYFLGSYATLVAQMATATVDEGHLSVSNILRVKQDLDNQFENLAKRKKPTRPAKNMQYYIGGGGEE